jgi:hypothetical protein
MMGSTAFIDFTRGDAFKPNPGPLRTPDWSIAIPHAGRRAGKLDTGRNDRHHSQSEQQGHINSKAAREAGLIRDR